MKRSEMGTLQLNDRKLCQKKCWNLTENVSINSQKMVSQSNNPGNDLNTVFSSFHVAEIRGGRAPKDGPVRQLPLYDTPYEPEENGGDPDGSGLCSRESRLPQDDERPPEEYDQPWEWKKDRISKAFAGSARLIHSVCDFVLPMDSFKVIQNTEQSLSQI